MSKHPIEQSIARAVFEETPDLLKQITSLPVVLETQEDLTMGEQIKNKRNLGKWFAGAAAGLVCVVSVAAAMIHQTNRVDSIISIDVNPSIQLKTNANDQVVWVNAENQDAQQVLDGMKLKKADLTTAVDQIMGQMVSKGYITQEHDAMLITVENKDVKKAQGLEEQLVGEINRTLMQNSIEDAKLYYQQVSNIGSEQNLAKQYGISDGKAAFIAKLAEKDPSLDIKELSEMKMWEIANLIEEKQIDLSDFSGYDAQHTTNQNVSHAIHQYVGGKGNGNGYGGQGNPNAPGGGDGVCDNPSECTSSDCTASGAGGGNGYGGQGNPNAPGGGDGVCDNPQDCVSDGTGSGSQNGHRGGHA